jgi:cytochrome c peroxidase
MLRKTLLALAALSLAVLAIPLANLFREAPDRHAAAEPMAAPRTAVLQTLDAHCADCHDPQAARPFYGRWPRARDVMESDVARGLAAFDLDHAFAGGPRDAAPEVTLARLEHVVRQAEMPPTRYVALHWHTALSRADREALLAWIHATRARYYAPPALPKDLRDGPLYPLRAPADLDAAKVAIGRALFHDPRLSGSGQVACASCHDLAHAGTVGRRGGLDTPTIFNAGLQARQTWDGDVPDLRTQCVAAVESPVEMGARWDDVLLRLRRDKPLARAVAATYPGGLTREAVADALATFTRSLATPDARFDHFLLGQDAALDASEKAGFHTFVTAGCATCHVGQALGGQSVEERPDGTPVKVPMLRNVAATAPYFHDGRTAHLRPAVAAMGAARLGRPLTDGEVDQVTAFLRSLTGTYGGRRLD